MKFYTYPRNLGSQRSFESSGSTAVPEIQDNKLSTAWSGTALRLYTDSKGDGTGDAREFDTVYAVCKDADSFTVSAFGSTVINIASEMADNYGNMLSVVDADGYHHILYKHSSKVSASTVNVTFNKAADVAQLWILDEDDSIEISNDRRFTELDYDEIDRGASVRESAINVPHYIPPIGQQDLKTDVGCVCRFKRGQKSYLFLKKFFRDNSSGFAVAIDYPAEATLVGLYIVDPQRRLRYISSFKYAGKNYAFSLIHK